MCKRCGFNASEYGERLYAQYGEHVCEECYRSEEQAARERTPEQQRDIVERSKIASYH